jgi:hypothetical protein
MILIDITPTSCEFLHNGKIYQIAEIMESGKTQLMIVANEKLPEPATTVVSGEDELIKE